MRFRRPRIRSRSATYCAGDEGESSTTGTDSASSSAARRPRAASRRPRVFLDTNALFLPVKSGFPLEQEVDRCRPGARIEIPSSVIAELDLLVGHHEPWAGAARTLADRFPVVRSRGRGDDAVLGVAVRQGAWVVTADRVLAKRLVARHVTALVPRDRQRLEIVRGRPRAIPHRERREGVARPGKRGNG